MAIVSFVVSIATGKVGARYAAMMFMVPGVYASYVVGLAWVSNTLPRPAAKVSDFFFSFPSFSLSNSGRGKKKKRRRRRREKFGVRRVRAFGGGEGGVLL